MKRVKITLRHAEITPQQAYKTVTDELYERQRPLNQSYVQQYAMEILRDELRPGTLISFCAWKRKRYLINGQHTLRAIILAKRPQLLGIEEIEVEEYEDIAWWYTKYDRVNNRTLDHSYRALNLPEKLHLNHTETKYLAAALPMLAAGFDQVPTSKGSLRMYVANPTTRQAFLYDWIEEATRFFELIKGAPNGIHMNLRRAPVLAFALVTLRYTGTDADDFWKNAVWDDGLAATDPRKHLNYHLRTTELTRYAPHVYSRYIASAWSNAWHNKPIKTLQPQAAHLPIRIEGTPHTSKATMRYITPMGEVLHDPVAYNPEQWQQQMFPSSDLPQGEDVT